MAANRDTTERERDRGRQGDRKKGIDATAREGGQNKDEERRGGRLRDEDMHINRETSTEMSDHRE